MNIETLTTFLTEKATALQSKRNALKAELEIANQTNEAIKAQGLTYSLIDSEINRLLGEISKHSSTVVSIKLSIDDNGEVVIAPSEATTVKSTGVTTQGSNTLTINGKIYSSANDAAKEVLPQLNLEFKSNVDNQAKLFNLALLGKISYARANGVVVEGGEIISGKELLTAPQRELATKLGKL